MSKQPVKASGQFRYFKDGSTSIEVSGPPPPEGSTPWHVVIRSEHVIPISVLVFALTSEAALERVLFCLRECAAKGHKSEYPNRAAHHIKQYEAGECWHEVSALDTTRIVAHVNWASNGGVC